MRTNIDKNSLHNINYRTNHTSNIQSINVLKEKYTIPVNQALTDSLSLKIPLDLVDVIDERLTSLTSTVYEATGEIDLELSPPKPLVIVKNGMTVRIGLSEIPIYQKETGEYLPTKFVNLTVSTKLLKERYFEGININNISVIHQTFMEFGIFECSLDHFLEGMASDIDVCVNRYTSTIVEFSKVCESLKTQSGDKGKHIKLFGDGSNIGINFNRREFAKPSLPFVKGYHKELELLNKSAEFFNAYLIPYSYAIKNLTRVEATIKNYAHKVRLAKYLILPKFKTLKEYLEIPESQLYNFVCFSLSSYVEIKPRLKAPELSPMDHIIFELIQNCILKGYDYQSLLCIADTFKGTTQGSTDVGRSRIRKRITELFDLQFAKDAKMEKQVTTNKNVLDYLRAFKIGIN